MKGNGQNTNSMEKVRKHGQMALFMKVVIRMDTSMVRELCYSLHEISMKEILILILFKVMESIHLLMEIYTKDIGKIIRDMVMESYITIMEIFIRVSLFTIKLNRIMVN